MDNLVGEKAPLPGASVSDAERDYLTALVADLKALYWQQPSEGKDAYELLAEELNSAKVMRDELLELFAVNAARTSGHTGSGRIGSILDRLLAQRSFDPIAGNRAAVGSEALDPSHELVAVTGSYGCIHTPK